jgi:hypothetical protein
MYELYHFIADTYINKNILSHPDISFSKDAVGLGSKINLLLND